jgi:hypothetical protein
VATVQRRWMNEFEDTITEVGDLSGESSDQDERSGRKANGSKLTLGCDSCARIGS